MSGSPFGSVARGSQIVASLFTLAEPSVHLIARKLPLCRLLAVYACSLSSSARSISEDFLVVILPINVPRNIAPVCRPRRPIVVANVPVQAFVLVT